MILVNVKYALVTMQGRWAVGCLFVSMERSHKVRTRNLVCKTSLISMLCEWTFTIMSHRQTTMCRRKPKRTCCHLQICSHLRCTTVSIVHIPKLLVVLCVYILVGGFKHFLFFHTLGIIIPTDFHIFQRGRNHQPVHNNMYISEVNSLYDIYIKIIGPLETPFSQVQIPDLGRDVLWTHCSFSCDAGSFTGAKQDRLFFRTAGRSFRRAVDVGHRGTR